MLGDHMRAATLAGINSATEWERGTSVSPGRPRLADTDAVPVGVGDLEVSAPRVVVDHAHATVGGYGVDVRDPQVHESAGHGVARVLGEVEAGVVAHEADVERLAGLEPVLELRDEP